ncbi:hypothetical protein V6N12_071033 [Hibiscus sabdariffa]|uniref:MaoC-like domain-containing protein n=1 Tax=Hibiscus sabdariffa TaxID=183260 RepID=A0ABR2FIL1_9ROSI
MPALGVGACGRYAIDTNELKYVYHENGQQFIKVLPTFSTLFSLGSVPQGKDLPGFRFDPRLLLHGQQHIEVFKPLPSNATVITIHNKVSLAGLHDKGKAAYEEGSGELLSLNRLSAFLHGAGGFSDPSQPFTYRDYPANQLSAIRVPESPPYAVFEDCTQPSQACVLLFVQHCCIRLSGDYNPLHSDPMFAEVSGFPRPILHGLCTLGFAVRAIIKRICRGDPDMVKTISGRFLLHVYPGETLVTEMWLQDLRVIYRVKAKDRNLAVLSGFVHLHGLAASL